MNYNISFYGGLTTIGGVHIAVSDTAATFIFDLGLKPSVRPSTSLQITPDDEIKSYLLTRLAPPVLALYKKDLIYPIDLNLMKSVWNRDINIQPNPSVFISHIHQDHMGLLPYLDSSVYVYMHHEAYQVYKALIDSNEIKATAAKIIPLNNMETFKVGTMQITLIEVDHDTPGASGFLLELGKRRIAFTGDWRRHGHYPEKMNHFEEYMKKNEIDILITEGTRLNPDNLFKNIISTSEHDILERYQTLLSDHNALVYVNILPRNVLRFANFIKSAIDAGRIFVLDNNTFTYWSSILSNSPSYLNKHPLQEMNKNMRVLESQITELVDPSQIITVKEIVNQPHNYVVFVNYEHTHVLTIIEGLKGSTQNSIYFHADGNPLNNHDQYLLSLLNHFNVEYIYTPTGGHASPNDIKELISTIHPKVVIPLHSLYPTLCESEGIPRFFPILGETVDIETIIPRG